MILSIISFLNRFIDRPSFISAEFHRENFLQPVKVWVHSGPGLSKPQNSTLMNSNDQFSLNICSHELRTLFIFWIRQFLGSRDPCKLRKAWKFCQVIFSFLSKKAKKLSVHFKKWILWNQTMIVEIRTSMPYICQKNWNQN